MAALYLSNAEGIQFSQKVFSELGIRVEGAALQGLRSVRGAQEVADSQTQRPVDVQGMIRELGDAREFRFLGSRW